jgi:hypothetical protein
VSPFGIQKISNPNGRADVVGDMRGHAGDKLQIIHHLLLGAVLAIAIADFALSETTPTDFV